MDWLFTPDALVGLLTLTVLEIVLGIDNIIFISILAGKLPEAQQAKARQVGLGLALVTRILLLLSISWLVGLTTTLFELPFLSKELHDPAVASSAAAAISGRDLVLLLGGLFLLGKATFEIHERLEGPEEHSTGKAVAASFTSVIVQILLLDIVFSLDSVITAVGMVDEVGIMIIAVIIAVAIMLVAAGPISNFVNRHPTVKMLALAFLLLIGMTLVAEGFDQHISKGYVYFAMAFSVFVEMLNLRSRKGKPVELHNPYGDDTEAAAASKAGAA